MENKDVGPILVVAFWLGGCASFTLGACSFGVAHGLIAGGMLFLMTSVLLYNMLDK